MTQIYICSKCERIIGVLRNKTIEEEQYIDNELICVMCDYNR